MTDKYAVIGNPIAHSKSPLIHELFAKQTGQDISYERILAPTESFDVTVRQLISQGYKGVNVTVPFKFEAFLLANQYSSSALGAGAANTLSFENNTIKADNTDGAGLVRDLEQNLNVGIAGKRLMLIGAGGAAEGVLQPLLESNPKSITVVNRTIDKAIGMIKKVEVYSQCGDTTLSACTFEVLQGQVFDIVINATSAGLTDTALPIPNTVFAEGCLAYDMMYGRETPFMKLAKHNGAQVADGLGMLVEQAAESFYIWRGVRPETQTVMQQLRNLS